MAKFSPAQLRAQRAFAARARARSKASRSSTRKRSSPKRSPMARRATRRSAPRRSRRFGRSRRSKSSWLDMAADANIAIQAAEPMLPAVAAAMKGDAAGAVAAAKVGLKEVVSPANLVQAAGPKLGLGLAKKAMRFFGVAPKTKFGGRKLI